MIFASPTSQLQQILDNTPRHQYNVIVAMDKDLGFAKNKNIPWKYPEDLAHFKRITANFPCVMGRHTYEEINQMMGEKGARFVLPGRKCFVVSSTLSSVSNAVVVPSLRAVEFHLDDPTNIFVLGGYKLFLEGVALANTVYITIVNDKHECDTFFPFAYVLDHFTLADNTKSSNPKLTYLTFKRK